MKITKLISSLTLLIMCFCTTLSYGQKKLNLINCDLEMVGPDGNFFMWKSQAVKGGVAVYSVVHKGVNRKSKKALKADVRTLGDNGWLVSTHYNKKFQANVGDVITVSFYAKTETSGKGKIKLVLQSDIKGSFQGKDFVLSNDWQLYTHKFMINEDSNSNQIKFWYLTEGTTYYLDNLSIEK